MLLETLNDKTLFMSNANWLFVNLPLIVTHFFQELVQEIDLPKKQQLLLEDQEKRIRLKLSKNLALALMAEGDSNDGFCI